MNRRNFLQASIATGLLAACSPSGQSAARALPRLKGVGLFSLPVMLAADFAKSIELLAKLGYREVEPFGPYAFSDPAAIASWARVTPSLGFSGSGFFGKSLAEAKAVFAANGIAVPSLHTDLATLSTRMGPLAEAANSLGAKYVTLPSIPADHRATLDDWRRTAGLFNRIGAEAARNGVRFAYHNHGYGLKEAAGTVPLDLLLSLTDPAQVLLEMDVFWTVAGGADPLAYLKRHSGRYRMLHLKDMKTIRTFEGDGGGADQWIPLFPLMTHLGDGALDIKAIIDTAAANGAEHYFVEQDRAADPEGSLGASARYLGSIGFS